MWTFIRMRGPLCSGISSKRSSRCKLHLRSCPPKVSSASNGLSERRALYHASVRGFDFLRDVVVYAPLGTSLIAAAAAIGSNTAREHKKERKKERFCVEPSSRSVCARLFSCAHARAYKYTFVALLRCYNVAPVNLASCARCAVDTCR